MSQIASSSTDTGEEDNEALASAATEPGPAIAPLSTERDPDRPQDDEPPPEAASLDTAPASPAEDPAPNTRDRILDAALDLFITHGFDGTSLRQIAEQLGVTKAALYYYFESKDDILMALHMRLHEFGREALAELGDRPLTPERSGALLNGLTDQMMAQRKIFLMHERNQAALEKLHSKDHMEEHEDLQARFRAVLSDERVPLRDRVRMAASFGAVFSVLLLFGDAFESVGNDELGSQLRAAVADVLQG
jgi:AcrR family transcriptional regulator